MKKKWIYFVAPPAAILLFFVCGEIIMHLWNWLVPPLTGWRSVTFWQALGLWLLCRLLFGSWGSGSQGKRNSKKQYENTAGLSAEEREKLRGGMGAQPTPESGTGEHI